MSHWDEPSFRIYSKLKRNKKNDKKVFGVVNYVLRGEIGIDDEDAKAFSNQLRALKIDDTEHSDEKYYINSI